jgi:hypothetical protein
LNVIIDDHLLREVLLEQEPSWLRRLRRGGRILTTGCWYYRLCSAWHDDSITGSLSGPIAALPAELQAGVIEKVMRLPDSIGLISMHDLAWSASRMGRVHGLNLLASEALAAAVQSDSVLATAAINLPPRLQDAAAAEGIRVVSSPIV